MAKVIKLPLRREQIQEILPHRDPFLMVDEVYEFEDLVHIAGRKLVRPEEEHFKGHFPGRPIMPGVLILEAVAQMGALFAKLSTGGVAPEDLIVFTGAQDVRFRRVVVPGDMLDIRLGNHRTKGPHWRMDGQVYVGNERAAEATIMATVIGKL
jgi:3-hydroxyacyl-[acyl-carrier-protein] dehydratase